MTNGVLKGYDFPMDVAAPLGVDVESGQRVQLNVKMLNRHGIVSGATGTGKSRTLQSMAEWLSQHGISTVLADGKGDMSGLARKGILSGALRERAQELGQMEWWEGTSIPTEFLALGGQGIGVRARVTVGSFGYKSLGKITKMTDPQLSALGNVYRVMDGDSTRPTENIEDLCAVVRGLRDDPDHSLTESMAARIIDKLEKFDWENPGLFGGPEFDIMDLIRTDDDGWGYVSIIDSSKLSDKPEVLTTFLLWMLDQLSKHLPEVGDNEMKLVCLLDEAHIMFEDAPKEFVHGVLRTIRKLRSKGVGVIFGSQNASDIPEAILGQCGLRIQHALRANTPKALRALRATVDTFPMSARYNIATELTGMGIGEALVCIIDDDGRNTDPAVTRMYVPRTSLEPLEDDDTERIVAQSELSSKYRRMEWELEERERQRKTPPAPMVRLRAQRDAEDDESASGVLGMLGRLRDRHSGSPGPVSTELIDELGMDQDDIDAVTEYLGGERGTYSLDEFSRE